MAKRFRRSEFSCCRYKNGKLYMFYYESVTVVKMMPSGPAAWCKSVARPWFTPCLLPAILKEAMVEAARKSHDAPAVEAPGVSGSLPETPPNTKIKYYQYHVKPQVDFLRENFDHALLRKAATYQSHHLEMCKLFMLEGGIELAKSNPALAYMTALNRIFCMRKDAKPWRRARAMLKMKRRKILSMCGFPDSESLVHIIKRIKPVTVKKLFFIRSALRRDPELLRILSFVEKFSGNALAFATMPEMSGVVTAQLLNEVSQSRRPYVRHEHFRLLRDTIRMSVALGENLGRLRSLKEIKRKHDELTVPYTAKMKLEIANASFPEPPFDGLSTSDFEIFPVLGPQMLHKWAKRQHNCVMTRFGSIVMAKSAIYMVRRPVEATLEILRVRKENVWKLGDLKGTCNSKVSATVTGHVMKWFSERKNSPRHVEVPKSFAEFTLSDFYEHLAGEGIPVPEHYEYDPHAVIGLSGLEWNAKFAIGPIPDCVEPDFMVKSVHSTEEISEILKVNPYMPMIYFESARRGDVFVYVVGIHDKRLVFLSAKKFPERKIEIELVYPHSERVTGRLREWIDDYVYVNGFPLVFKDENQLEFALA